MPKLLFLKPEYLKVTDHPQWKRGDGRSGIAWVVILDDHLTEDDLIAQKHAAADLTIPGTIVESKIRDAGYIILEDGDAVFWRRSGCQDPAHNEYRASVFAHGDFQTLGPLQGRNVKDLFVISVGEIDEQI